MHPNVIHGLVTLPVRRLSQACALMAVVSLAACGDALETTQTAAADPTPAASETALSTGAALEQKLKALEAQLAALGDLPADDPEPDPEPPQLAAKKAPCSSPAECNRDAFDELVRIVESCGARLDDRGSRLVWWIGGRLKRGDNWDLHEGRFYSLLSAAKGLQRGEELSRESFSAHRAKAVHRATLIGFGMKNVSGLDGHDQISRLSHAYWYGCLNGGQ